VQKVLSGQLPDRLPFNFWMDRDGVAEEAIRECRYWAVLRPSRRLPAPRQGDARGGGEPSGGL